MQVSKWGNSLAIRLPAAVVETLDLKDGDEIQVTVASTRAFEISRSYTREEALDTLRSLRKQLPAGFTFDRLAAHDR